MYKRIFALIMIFAVLTVSVNADDVKTYFSREGLSGEAAQAVMEGSVVMRVGNNEGYINNKRVEISGSNKSIRPFVTNGKAYVPCEFVLKGLGAQCEVNGLSMNAQYNERQISLSIEGNSNMCEVSANTLFAEAEEFSKMLGTQFYFDGNLIFFNPTPGVFDGKITDEIKNELMLYTDYEWDNIYMGAEGFVAGMVVHPKNPNLIYARTDVGGVYRLNEDGKTWTPLSYLFETNNIAFAKSTTSIALDPNNQNIIYAAHGSNDASYLAAQGGKPYDVFKSEDYGNTWTRTFLNKTLDGGYGRMGGEGIAVDPNNSDIVYVGTKLDGLYRSTDGAKTWEYVDGVPHGTPASENKNTMGQRIVMFDSNSPVINGKTSVLYVYVDGEGLYKSEDAGENFLLVEGSPKSAMRMQILGKDIYVAVGMYPVSTAKSSETKQKVIPGVYHYNGKTWSDITPPGEKRGYGSVAVNPKNKDEIFAFSEAFGAQAAKSARSLDGGKTWQKIDREMGANGVYMYDARDNYNSIIGTYGFGIRKLTNLRGAVSDIEFEEISKGVEVLCTISLMSLPSSKGSKLFIDVMDRGRYRLDDVNEKAQRVKPTMHDGTGMDYCASDPSLVMAVGSQARGDGPANIMVSADYGNTFQNVNWDKKIIPLNAAVSATVQKNGYPVLMTIGITGNKRGIYRSLDFGQTWELCFATDSITSFWKQSCNFLASDRVEGKTFYFADTNGDFYATTDGGDNWRLMSSLYGTEADKKIEAVPGCEKTLFYRDSAKGVYLTQDGGNSWNLVPGFTSCRAVGFGKNKDGIRYPSIYIYGKYNGKEAIYRSDDFTESWVRITDPGTVLQSPTDITGDSLTYGRVYVNISGSGTVCGQIIGTDDSVPVITMNTQGTSEEKGINYSVPSREYTITGSVSKSGEVHVNGQKAEVKGNGDFSYNVTLKDGINKFIIEAADENGKMAQPQYLTLNYVPSYVGLELADGKSEVKTNGQYYTVTGKTSEPCTVFYDGTAVATDDNNCFSIDVAVENTVKTHTFYAVDADSNASEQKSITVVYDNTPPEVSYDEVKNTDSDYIVLRGTLSEKGEVRINKELVSVNDDNTFSAFLKLNEGENKVLLEARDSIRNLRQPEVISIMKTAFDETKNQNISVAYADSEFKSKYRLDGDISEFELDQKMNKWFLNPTCDAVFGLRWDEDKLYAAVRVFDDALCNTASAVYNNDAVEIYLDGDNSKSTPFDEFDKQLMYLWGSSAGTTDYRWTDLSDGYCMEIEIPWSVINTTVTAGQKIGFDIDVCDNDGLNEPSSRNGVIIFNGTTNNWKDTSHYATLILNK